MRWKPREEYKTLQLHHKPILVRSTYGAPMVVVWNENGPAEGGHFYPVPGVPMFCGKNVFTMMVHDHFKEWMEIPVDLEPKTHKEIPAFEQGDIKEPWQPISDEMQKGLELAAYICNMYTDGDPWSEVILSKSEQIRGRWWMEHERRAAKTS